MTLKLTSEHSIVIMNIACDRELCSFIFVAPTDLFLLPIVIEYSISFTFLATSEDKSLISYKNNK
jgi:hypothetical protein